MANNRQNKINEEVLRELSVIIRGLKDSRIPLMTSITGVNVTKDLKYAKVYVSIMGDEEVQKNAVAGLKSAAGFVRRELASRLDLRNTPELQFEIDHSIEQGAYINKLIRKISDKDNIHGKDE